MMRNNCNRAGICARFLVLFFVAVTCLFRETQSAGLFKCPRQALVENFDIDKFVGHWYEIERSFNVVELAAKCLSIDIFPNKRGQLRIVATSTNKWSGKENTAVGVAVPGRRDVSIYQYKTSSILPNQLRPSVGTYQVIATDYDNYAVIWSCSDYTLFYRVFEVAAILNEKTGHAVIYLSDFFETNFEVRSPRFGSTATPQDVPDELIITEHVYTLVLFRKDHYIFDFYQRYIDFIWIFGRKREIDVNTRATVYDLLTKRGIDTDRLLIAGSNNCAKKILF